MLTADLVECMLRGIVCGDEACACYPDLSALRARVGDEEQEMPLQWAMISHPESPAIDLIARTALAILDLAQACLEGWQMGQDDGCALWHALDHAPHWLYLPDEPDDNVPEIALLLERDEAHDGDWLGLIEALHQAGSVEWQWAIRACRRMQRFESMTGVDCRSLLSPRENCVSYEEG